ncbi:hypothetical protein AAHH78_35440, partial [Burkholderia pseudomallei]
QTPGGRFNQNVVATNIPRWLTAIGDDLRPKIAIAKSGTIVHIDVDTAEPDHALDMTHHAKQLIDM